MLSFLFFLIKTRSSKKQTLVIVDIGLQELTLRPIEPIIFPNIEDIRKITKSVPTTCNETLFLHWEVPKLMFRHRSKE